MDDLRKMASGPIYSTAVDWLQRRQPAIVVEVVETRGSAPREEGARMLVGAEQTAGTIGGGHLELEAITVARELLARPAAAIPTLAPLTAIERQYALGPSLGQCCGGTVTLRFSALDRVVLAVWPEGKPLFHLQLYGAGHVGRAIARVLATLDCRVDWIDERDEEFAPAFGRDAWPAHVRKVCVDAVDGEVRTAPPGALYLVLTHNHDLDLRITEAILRRGDFAYLGLIGSKTKRNRFIHRFEQRGIAPEVIARMTCPIGVPGIEGKEPEVIAVSVVAQLLQRATVRNPLTTPLTNPLTNY